jgi:hypothetical protein
MKILTRGELELGDGRLPAPKRAGGPRHAKRKGVIHMGKRVEKQYERVTVVSASDFASWAGWADSPEDGAGYGVIIQG